MSKIYFYPKHKIHSIFCSNPYRENFEQSLSKNHIIVNKSVTRNGVLELFKYLFICDIYLFNWIEDIAIYRRGGVKTVVFTVFLLVAKLLRKKIVWILHNKYSHDVKNNNKTNLMFSLMMKYSNLIITHSLSGIEFAKENFPKHASKIKYLVHPVNEAMPVKDKLPRIYDFLIWGNIVPYKGIAEFLKFLKDSNESDLFNILIVGKCGDKVLKENLNRYLSENIVHLDHIYDLDEIFKFAIQSRFILFTHRSQSVLSSGLLMESIRMGANIIGPNFGAFKDLSYLGFVQTYNHFSDITKICRNSKSDVKSHFQRIQDFCSENSWFHFIEKLDLELNNI